MKGRLKTQERNLAVMLAMRSLGRNIAAGAALCRAFRVSRVPLMALDDMPWPAVVTMVRSPWEPGCGREAA